MPLYKSKNPEVELGPRQGAKRETVCFFEDQLKGEEALTLRTAKRLFDLANETCVRKPWGIMGDTDLVLVRDPQSQEMCYSSVMGALGQVFAVHAYCGMESYRLFKRLASGAPLTAGEFFGTQRSVTMEFLPSGMLPGPDRELARVLGHPLKRGTLAPQFRAGRPGYQPWYPTEAEGKVLALCVESVLAFSEDLEHKPEAGYWNVEDVYPEVFWKKDGYFRVENTLVQVTPPPLPELPKLDEVRLAKLSKGDYPVKGIVEVDEFYSAASVGGKNERKACVRMVMAADAEIRFLYMVHAFEPTRSVGEVLMEAVLQTVEKGRFVPAEVRVNDESKRLLLSLLRERLGFELRAVSELPSLESAKRELLQTLGDPGPISSD
jgi:uncharacterized protein (UPF0262 family)